MNAFNTQKLHHFSSSPSAVAWHHCAEPAYPHIQASGGEMRSPAHTGGPEALLPLPLLRFVEELAAAGFLVDHVEEAAFAAKLEL